MIFAFLIGVVVGAFVCWCVMDSRADQDWWREHPDTGAEPVCICPRFRDTGGFRLADLGCPVHGVEGTDPGDGYWETTQ